MGVLWFVLVIVQYENALQFKSEHYYEQISHITETRPVGTQRYETQDSSKHVLFVRCQIFRRPKEPSGSLLFYVAVANVQPMQIIVSKYVQ